MDFNWIHGSLGQNSGHETDAIGKFIYLAFRAYVEHPNGGRMQSGHQFEYEVVLDSELDSNSAIPNWIGSPPSRAHLLGSPVPS
jgi:hypothetical protein